MGQYNAARYVTGSSGEREKIRSWKNLTEAETNRDGITILRGQDKTTV
jgi:hypothetical protein